MFLFAHGLCTFSCRIGGHHVELHACNAALSNAWLCNDTGAPWMRAFGVDSPHGAFSASFSSPPHLPTPLPLPTSPPLHLFLHLFRFLPPLPTLPYYLSSSLYPISTSAPLPSAPPLLPCPVPSPYPSLPTPTSRPPLPSLPLPTFPPPYPFLLCYLPSPRHHPLPPFPPLQFCTAPSDAIYFKDILGKSATAAAKQVENVCIAFCSHVVVKDGFLCFAPRSDSGHTRTNVTDTTMGFS